MSHIVLLVDDEPNILHALVRGLHGQPYTIYTARSAEEALLIVKARHVDLIVSDLQMPGMCGIDLLAWMAEHLPNIPRIVVTGQPDVSAAVRAINDGRVYRFLMKPIDVLELALVIREALEQGANPSSNSTKCQSALKTTRSSEHEDQPV